MITHPFLCDSLFDTFSGAGGLWGLETPLQKYIREAKRMMYWYKNIKMAVENQSWLPVNLQFH